MTLSHRDTILCSGTLPFHTDLETRIEAAAAGGFTGLSLWVRDIERERANGRSDADIRAMFSAHGVQVAELDPFWRWLPGSDVDVDPEFDEYGLLAPRLDDFLAIAERFGARSLNACEIISDDGWTLDDAAAAFAGLCDKAAGHGLLVHLEFLPWSRIGDLDTAHDIVQRADRPNGGVMVDAWHFFRGRSNLDSLRLVPGNRITGVQLSDAPSVAAPDLMAESMNSRLFPGDGDCDVAGLCAVLDEIGAAAPRGVEVFSAANQRLDAVEVGRRAGASLSSCTTSS